MSEKPTIASVYEKGRVVDASAFDGPERAAVGLAGSFGSAVTALQDACLSDEKGCAVILTMTEFVALVGNRRALCEHRGPGLTCELREGHTGQSRGVHLG